MAWTFLLNSAATPLIASLAAAQASPAQPASSVPAAAGPIITTDELQRALPPLPPQSVVPPQALPPVDQYLQNLNVGVTPGSDPQMTQPLVPIDQFNVHAVDLAQPEPDTSPAELRYSVRIEGLETADRQTGVGLRSEFDNLSALGDGKGKAANEAMLSARLTEDTKLLQTILESEGWYSSHIDGRIDRSSATDGEPLTVVLSVSPGARYSLGSISISAKPLQPGLIRDNLPLKVGDPIEAAKVEAAEASLAVALPENGYAFATVGQRDILLDADTHLGDYTLPVTLGPLSRFGGFRTTGDLAFGLKHLRTIARFHRGELYDSRMVDDLRQALIATGLFTTVSVEPKRTGMPAAGGTEYATMLVTQTAGPPRTLAATAGYATGEGFKVQGSWTHRNLFPPEGALIATAVAGTREQGASGTFRRSNAGKRDRTFQATVEAKRSTYSAFKALTAQVAARLSYDSTPIWRKPLTWAVGAQILATIEDDYDFSIGARRNRKFLIAGLDGELGIDRTDSLLDPTTGFRAKTLIQPEASLSASLRPYVRGQIDASAYYSVGDSFVLAGRTRVASIVGADRYQLAPSRRLYAGGGGSVRGFAYQELGPKDPNGDPLGGTSVIEAAGEARYRFGDYGAVAFVDAGQVYETAYPDFSGVRVGVGIGARYYTNFGPLRIDIATPLGRRSGESLINVYVSIGQAF